MDGTTELWWDSCCPKWQSADSSGWPICGHHLQAVGRKPIQKNMRKLYMMQTCQPPLFSGNSGMWVMKFDFCRGISGSNYLTELKSSA